MIFDITSFIKYLKKQTDVYMEIVEAGMTNQNPTFVEDLKNNRDFYNEDGTLKQDISPDVLMAFMEKLVTSPDFKVFEYNEELIDRLFIIDKELLKKFVIE